MAADRGVGPAGGAAGDHAQHQAVREIGQCLLHLGVEAIGGVAEGEELVGELPGQPGEIAHVLGHERGDRRPPHAGVGRPGRTGVHQPAVEGDQVVDPGREAGVVATQPLDETLVALGGNGREVPQRAVGVEGDDPDRHLRRGAARCG